MENKTNNTENEILKTANNNNKKMNLLIIGISLFMVLVVVSAIIIILKISSQKNGNISDTSDIVSSLEENETENNNSSVYNADASSNNNVSSSGNANSTSDNSNPQNSITNSSDNGENNASDNKSQKPRITICAQVADKTYIIGGVCSKNTEYILASGDNIKETKIIPFAGGNNSYFTSQIRITSDSKINISAKEKNKELSSPEVKLLMDAYTDSNYMTSGEYSPVFGKNSQMHFYSALLSYSVSTNKLTNQMRNQSKGNIQNIVSSAKKVGAETIFLIIPSSADIYPETVPDGYTKTAGESLYKAFEKIATDCGAKVIYPLETMKKHRNDGEGYQIYQHTDSHWSAYGSYWGTYDLMQYISAKFPNAKPRSVSEMGFYTKEMYGGDALFNFPKYIGFENSYNSGKAPITEIKELTTLYKLKTPTSTLSSIYNNEVGLYLTEGNAKAATVNNPNGDGLPTALIMRDSFGKVSYDMLNDRFKTVHWGEFDNYKLPTEKLNSDVDYVIYLYSERNLLKLMLNNSAANILILK